MYCIYSSHIFPGFTLVSNPSPLAPPPPFTPIPLTPFTSLPPLHSPPPPPKKSVALSAPLLQEISGVMALGLCLQAVPQAPQHFIPSQMQATSDGCIAHQPICLAISQDTIIYTGVFENVCWTLIVALKTNATSLGHWSRPPPPSSPPLLILPPPPPPHHAHQQALN